MNNRKIANELRLIEKIKKDTFVKRSTSNFTQTIEKIIEQTGVNPLGEIVLFGNYNSYYLAWAGISKKTFYKYLKNSKLIAKHTKNFEYVKLNNKLYLSYDWPLVVLSNKLPDLKKGFFSDKSPKISIKDLQIEENKNSTVWGFIKPDLYNSGLLKLIPIKEKTYISVIIDEQKTEFNLYQKNLKLQNQNFLPSINNKCLLVLSCPWDTLFIKSVNILPNEIVKPILKMISKPVNQLNFEVLDTITSTEQVITYDMDIEFKLTQKIYYKYKTYPGMYLELFKTQPDTQTKISSEFFKQKLSENTKSYVLQSGNKTFEKLPDYYFYANIDLLRTDPFWKPFCSSHINKVEIFTSPYKNGSITKIKLHY